MLALGVVAAAQPSSAADRKVTPADMVIPAVESHALAIDRMRPVLMTASLGGPASIPELDAAEPQAPQLTTQALEAYVARQQALENFDHFDVQPELTPEVLSAYIERKQNPALDAIDQMDLKPSFSTEAGNALNTAILEDYAVKRFVPTAQKVKLADGERLCLTQAIYHEARGESEQGQWAVANVIINRAFSKKFPTTICGVVFQNARKGSHSCQFSFACDGRSDMGKDMRAWRRAEQIADQAFAEFQQGDRPDVLPKSALYYHARYVAPSWSRTFQRVATIGTHVFYSPNS